MVWLYGEKYYGSLTQRIYRADGDEARRRGRPRMTWKEEVGELVEKRNFSFEECMRLAIESSDWKMIL